MLLSWLTGFLIPVSISTQSTFLGYILYYFFCFKLAIIMKDHIIKFDDPTDYLRVVSAIMILLYTISL